MAARVIAVTGGIASGKSEATRRFEALGVPVLDADLIARALVAPGQPALAEIVARFGPQLVDDLGALDRRKLRDLIFADARSRRHLEAILHPRVRQALRDGARDATAPYVILAIPLLAESGHYGWVDRVLVIDVPPEVQLQRVMARDKVPRASAQATVAAQASRAARLALAHDVIVNDGSLDELGDAVERMHSLYLAR